MLRGSNPRPPGPCIPCEQAMGSVRVEPLAFWVCVVSSTTGLRDAAWANSLQYRKLSLPPSLCVGLRVRVEAHTEHESLIPIGRLAPECPEAEHYRKRQGLQPPGGNKNEYRIRGCEFGFEFASANSDDTWGHREYIHHSTRPHRLWVGLIHPHHTTEGCQSGPFRGSQAPS